MAKKKTKSTTAKKVQQDEDKPFHLPTVAVRPEPDDEPWGRNGLTQRERLFVKAYLGPAAGNASRAAEMAGYRSENRDSLKVTAHRTLTRANVQRALAKAFARHSGGKKWTLAGIVEIARTTMADFVTVGEDGKAVIDLAKARDGAALGSVKKLKIRETDLGQEIQIELYDRMPALTTLAKMHGTLVEKHEHTGADGGPMLIDRIDRPTYEKV